MPPLLMHLVLSRVAQNAPWLLRPVARMVAAGALSGFVIPQLKTHMAYWEAELERDLWFGGSQLTTADIIMSFPVQAAAARVGLDGMPKLAGFLDRIEQRPAYQRAVSRGGPFSLLH